MKKKIFITILLLSITFTAGYQFGRAGYEVKANIDKRVVAINKEKPETIETQLDMNVFWRAVDELEERYLDAGKINGQKMLYGAIAGMTSSLDDPYTAFFTPQQNDSFQDSLEGVYEGIGAQLGFEEGQLVIVSPLEDSPTEKAGVKPGDAILAVDGESTRDWSIPQAVNNIRGEEGTNVTLRLFREEKPEPFDVEITRQEIKIPSVRLEWVGEGENIAHLQLLRFGTDTKKEWNEKVADLSYQISSGGVKGVILDVRNNPGGLLDAAIHLGSEFFKDGIVVKRELASGKIEEFKVNHDCRLCKVKTLVLVNKGSASASEIVAGALKVRGRARLVGEKTFGKGTVQEAVQLSEGAAMHITTARWLLPDGSNIHEEGIAPDVVVEANGETENDLQLEKAVKLINSK